MAMLDFLACRRSLVALVAGWHDHKAHRAFALGVFYQHMSVGTGQPRARVLLYPAESRCAD